MGEVESLVGSSATDSGLAWDRLTGSQVGRFVVQSRLGAGGAAVVYQAYDQVAGRTVALKVLPPNAEAASRDRFRREALMAGALRHPHIVLIYQVSASAAGLAYIAMELVEGESLSDLLSRRHLLQAEESCNLLAPIAEALAHAHRQGVVHRDVKPSNILLKPASPGAVHSVQMQSIDHPVVPMLTDFGVARYLDAPELTSAGRTVGTPAYMAPEQCAGAREIDGRADIYALGTVLYRCVSGRLPFSGATTQVMHAQIYDPVMIEDRVLQGLSPEVIEVLHRSLAKLREHRYADAAEMAFALRHAAGKGSDAWSRSTTDSPETVSLVSAEADRTATLANSVPAANTSSGFGGPSSVLIPATGLAGSTGSKGDKKRDNLYLSRRAGWIAVAGMAMALALGWSVYGMSRSAPGTVSLETTQSEGTPTLAVVAAANTFEPTKMPTATSTPEPPPPVAPVLPAAEEAHVITSVTDAPASDPTMAPTAVSTPATEMEDMVAPTGRAAEERVIATVQATPTRDDEIVVACSGVVDEFFVETLTNMDGAVQSGFSCPSDMATSIPGVYWVFESGLMLHLDESPVIYVYYSRTGEWEQVVPQAPGTLPAPEGLDSPPPGRYAPTGKYAEIWMPAQRRSALGYATAPDSVRFEAIVQTFPGGLLIGNTDDGSVLILERAKLRL